jgi:hypothetical protein
MVTSERGALDAAGLVLHRPPETLRRTLDLFWPQVPRIEVAA